jgi:hypothetical protein
MSNSCRSDHTITGRRSIILRQDHFPGSCTCVSGLRLMATSVSSPGQYAREKHAKTGVPCAYHQFCGFIEQNASFSHSMKTSAPTHRASARRLHYHSTLRHLHKRTFHLLPWDHHIRRLVRLSPSAPWLSVGCDGVRAHAATMSVYSITFPPFRIKIALIHL